MYTIKTILIFSLICLVNFSFLPFKKSNINQEQLTKIKALSQELCEAYNEGKNMVLVTKEGLEIINPNEAELMHLAPESFNENRVRVTLTSNSDNNLCSTELVITDKSGELERNYSINNCSSFGWIFFTPSNCFDVAIYHDAGSEAPFGNSVHGSVDWTFKFNQKTKISGTYMDRGAANMFSVARPCYDGPIYESVKTISNKNNAPLARKRIGK
jgi:hypothetical protein